MQEFYKVVRILRKSLPKYKFRVRRLKMPPTAYGWCERKEDGVFVISIHDKLGQDMAIQILLHELAHMLAWDAPGDLHNADWGKAYSKIYRLFLSKYIHEEM